ncbi:EP23 [Perigonia lusca single nucleopolyhedrovirus]|uniref:EP23 n=1 Tax=Perigonia lusca single nucleopolyhedrovirus TaxID=1675865 RepID=A0A0M3WNZ2_9ABAC|nr:EP23 [Perigonia lusca single nucleopolyhedrovirus]AKN80621.1 EP23 [Perigonia lusca single nucleopolyhedrovirus]
MNVNLYFPNSDNDNIITFTVSNTYDSIKMHVYAYNNLLQQHDLLSSSTKMVSGYEKNHRKINMILSSVPPQLSAKKISGYIVACIRLPCVCTKLLFHNMFSKPLSAIVVQTAATNKTTATEVWHILSVQKHKEALAFTKVGGAHVCLDGTQRYFAKELIALTGNVSSGLVSSLMQSFMRKQDVDIVSLVYPHVPINTEPVVMVFTT